MHFQVIQYEFEGIQGIHDGKQKSHNNMEYVYDPYKWIGCNWLER